MPPRPSFGGHAALDGVPMPPAPSPPSGSGTADRAGAGSTTAAADGTTLTIAQSNCRASASTPADLQSQFDRRGPVWGGGDGADPIPIDQGRTVWLFGDTIVGGGPYGGPLDNLGFVHNSIAVQYDDSCFLYLFRSDAAHHWYSTIADPNPQEYYWPLTGAYDPATGVLSVVAALVHIDIPGPWGWRVVGTDVFHYRMNPVMTLVGSERLFTYGTDDPAQFGTDSVVDQGQVYFHGCAQSIPTECYVARTDLGVHASQLKYHADSGWVSSPADADPIDLAEPVGMQMHVIDVGDGFVASNQIPLMSFDTWGWWAPTAIGPYRPIGRIIDEMNGPAGPLHSNWFTYGGQAINTSAGTIGVFNVNTKDDEVFRVAGVYGPRFVALDPHVRDPIPFGDVERTAPSQGATHVVGWAIDPLTVGPVDVSISIDGAAVATTRADVPRPDVERAVPGFGPDHGFDVTVALGPGVHQVCAIVANRSLGRRDQVIGCAESGPSGPPSTFHAVDPVRILDSRTGVGGFTSPWSPGETRSLALAGHGAVPSDATAVIVNVTVTNTSAPGFLTVAPSGGQVPNASNLNFSGGETAANLVTAQIGSQGRVDITSTAARTDVVADLVGYYSPGGGDLFEPVVPARILDSRTGMGGYSTPWGPGEQRPLTIAGVAPVPAEATAVAVNVTVTDATDDSWLRVGPAGGTPTVTSNLNFVRGETVPNLVVVRLGTGGQVVVTNERGHVNVVADVVGYFTAATGGRLVPVAPVRILDSRVGTGGYRAPWPAGSRRLAVGGIDPVPADATAVVVNVTVTEPTELSWLRIGPTGQPATTTSNLNFMRGQTIPNLVIVQLGTNGQIDITNLAGSVDVIVDVVGYYRASTG